MRAEIMYPSRKIAVLLMLIAVSVALFSSKDVSGDIDLSTKDHAAIQSDPDPQARWRVGQFFVLGNHVVPDQLILEQCPLFPGKLASVADLRESEKNLARLGLFVIDCKQGIRPRVAIVDREDEFRDVEIEVKEKPNVKQLLALRESIRFVVDWRIWGLDVAVYRAIGFPTEILDLIEEGELREALALLTSSFRRGKKGCTRFVFPAATRP